MRQVNAPSLLTFAPTITESSSSAWTGTPAWSATWRSF